MPRFAVLVASLSFAQRTKEVRNGEMLDLTGGRKPETEFSPEVIRMFDAITSNSPDVVNGALAALPQGAIDIRGPRGNTPLFESVLKHHVHSVELLLKRGANNGANPRLINVDGYDALDAAAFGGCAMCAHALIEAGLDPKTVRHDGFNALHRAIWGDTPQHTETVKVILEAGVSPSMIANMISTRPDQQSGPVPPINMVNENEATKALLEEWILKEANGEVGKPTKAQSLPKASTTNAPPSKKRHLEKGERLVPKNKGARLETPRGKAKPDKKVAAKFTGKEPKEEL